MTESVNTAAKCTLDLYRLDAVIVDILVLAFFINRLCGFRLLYYIVVTFDPPVLLIPAPV